MKSLPTVIFMSLVIYRLILSVNFCIFFSILRKRISQKVNIKSRDFSPTLTFHENNLWDHWQWQLKIAMKKTIDALYSSTTTELSPK